MATACLRPWFAIAVHKLNLRGDLPHCSQTSHIVAAMFPHTTNQAILWTFKFRAGCLEQNEVFLYTTESRFHVSKRILFVLSAMEIFVSFTLLLLVLTESIPSTASQVPILGKFHSSLSCCHLSVFQPWVSSAAIQYCCCYWLALSLRLPPLCLFWVRQKYNRAW